mgnify:CR=1 FL=1
MSSQRMYEWRLQFNGTSARGYVSGVDIFEALEKANVCRGLLARGATYHLRVKPAL